MKQCTLAKIITIIATVTVGCIIMLQIQNEQVTFTKTISKDMVQVTKKDITVKENGNTVRMMVNILLVLQISLNKSDFIICLSVLQVLFTNLSQMARYSNKNGTMVKNCMKKNCLKILEIHSRLTLSLSNLLMNKKKIK